MNQINFNNRFKHWPMKALETMLLIVSAWRTYDFITQIMGDLPGAQFYALFSVAISEGAYIVWSKFAYPNADEGNQESVSIGLIALNTLGLMLLSFGENLIRATSSFAWSQAASEILKYTPWAMLAINLIGALLFGVLDDDHIDSKTVRAQLRTDRNAERELAHAERMSHISAKMAAIKLLQDQSPEIAQKLAPYYVQSIRERVSNQTIKNLNSPTLSQDLDLDHAPEFRFPEPIEISSNGGNHRPKAL